ncbi:MAG: MATE family efflux transporter [Fusobacterium sp.]|nr:MATE family efflux transporter [Fusobacterium sp.]
MNNFKKSVIALLVPMVLQNLINVAVTSADILMISKVGEISLAAVSLASQIQFVLTLIYFGLASGATVLTAQYWGKKDIKTIEKIIGLTIKISFCVSFLFFCFTFFFSNFTMKIFANNINIIKEGVKYLRVVSISYLVTSISVVYLNIMRSVEKVLISTIIYAISLIVNILINYCLIFGNFYFPALGVVGAAIGTLVARTLELGIALYYDYKNKNSLVPLIKKKYIFASNSLLRKDFFKYSIPVICNEILWSTGIATSVAILGRLGSTIVAANSVTNVVRQLAMVVGFGIANATAIMVGKEIGAHNYKTAELYAKKFFNFSLISGICGSILIFLISPLILKYFGVNNEVREYLSFMLKILFYYIICQNINTTLIVGTFRAGGDTKFALFLDAFSLWGWSIIISALAAFYFKLPNKIVYILLMSDEIIKTPISIWRYKKKKWLNNVTRNFD